MGAALLLEASAQPGITGSTFMANSAGWPAATLFNPHQAPGKPAGLHIDSDQLLASFLGLDTRAAQWMKEQHTDPEQLRLACVHQPSVPFVRTFCERLGVHPDAIVPTFHRTGNMGAATLPSSWPSPSRRAKLRPGMQVALFGMASGASGGVMLIDW